MIAVQVEELTVRQARALLREWWQTAADRDRRVYIAHHAGVTKTEIHTLTGLARSTINKILDTYVLTSGDT